MTSRSDDDESVADLYSSSSPLRSFSPFIRLPRELRQLIWEFSVPDGRIVQLRYASYRPHAQPSTRSPSFAALHASTLSRNPKLVAQHTLHSLDFAALYALTLSQNTGLDPLDFAALHKSEVSGRGETQSAEESSQNQGDTRTMPLFGIKALNSNPGGLFACPESHLIYSKYYEVSTFGTLSPDHEIWFDFKRDTLFLDYDFGESYGEGWFRMEALGDDMLRVKRLAICDRVPVKCYDPRVGPIEETDSELIADILIRFGRQVTELTLVIEHYKSIGPDLAAAPFCDIDTLIGEYSRPYEYVREKSIQQFTDGFDKVAQLMMDVDLFALGSAAEIIGIDWSLPNIQRSVFARTNLVDDFNRAKARYDKEKKAYIVALFDEVCGPHFVTDLCLCQAARD